MDPVFWKKRWQECNTGWHSDQVNPILKRYWNRLNLERETIVLVPLCGKSRDLAWLAGQGHTVVGVEISDIAVHDFFRDLNVTPETEKIGALTLYVYQNLRIWHGDFFDLEPGDIPKPDGIYDRAALIALPPDRRKTYAADLISLSEPDTQLLLLTFEYDQEEMAGPPFSVQASEVDQLFGEHFDIDLLYQHSILENRPDFRKAGLTSLVEKVYHIHPNGV